MTDLPECPVKNDLWLRVLEARDNGAPDAYRLERLYRLHDCEETCNA